MGGSRSASSPSARKSPTRFPSISRAAVRAVIYLGRVMEIGPSRRVVASPRHPYTEALISAVPDAGGSRKRIILQGDAPSPVAPPSGCVFRTRCRYALPACAGEVPALREVAPGHWKACLRDDVPKGG